jgi:alanine racemase
MLEALDYAARDAGTIADVHLKIDTGMHRLGFQPGSVNDLCNRLTTLTHIRVDGLLTHLASADSSESDTMTQLSRFNEAVARFRDCGIRPRQIHAGNSAAAFAYPESWGNMLRPGGALYGFSRDVLPPGISTPPPLQPVMSLRTRIALLKTVAAGEKLGYGGTFTVRRDSVIATLPVGYDDGYRRAFSNQGRVIVRGQFAPVVGRVSMDLTLIDVTEVSDVSLDDEVTILGQAGDLSITAEDLAETIGTISYEITCGISSRVPRVYRETP